MGSNDSRALLVALATVGLCLLSLSLLAVGSGGAAAPLDGNDTNVTDTTTNTTTETVTETVSDTTETVSNTTESTTDTVSDTTTTTESTTETISDTTDSTTETVSNTTDQTGEAVTNTTTTSSSDSLLTVDDGETLLSTDSTSSSDGSTESTLTEELADVTGALTDGVTDTTTTAVSGVSETTDTVVGDDGMLTTVGDSVVSGSTLSTTGDATLTGLDQSTPAGTPAPADQTGDSTPPPESERPRSGTEDAAAVEGSTPAPSGGDGSVGTLAAMASRSFSEPIPISGQAAAGAGLAVGAAAAAGTVLLRGSSFTGTGAGRSAVRAVRHAAPQAVRRAGSSVLDRLLRMATLFRYSRYDDSDPLENEARAAVMEAVEADPGRPITEVAAAADVNLSTARYHVRVLQKEDMLMRAEVRGRKRLFPAFTQDPELLAALSDDATAPLVDALQRLEPATVGDLADELEKSPSTVTHHLQRLEEDGVVVRERDGRSVKNSLAPPTREALAPSAEAETEAPATAQSAD